MAFQFICDEAQCLNCGACMDLCPPQCLDMTRPGGGAEGSIGLGDQPWMMALPVQTARCTGCGICEAECPVNAITIRQTDGPVAFAPTQGPLYDRAPESDGWVPLSALTHETLKRVKTDPWGTLHRWKPRVSPHATGGPR